MRFNISEPVERACDVDPRVGDVFPAKGGGHHGARMWLVLAIKPNDVHICLGLDHAGNLAIKPNDVHICLGLDHAGNIVGAAHYGAHVMRGRELIGRVHGLEELQFDVEPLS